jgi:hypothetical protein
MKTITELNEEKSQLLEIIRGGDLGHYTKTVPRIREIETQIKSLQLQSKVEEINKKEMAIKDFLADLLKLGVIDPDLFTNEGKMHKGRTLRKPKVTQFFTKYKYARISVSGQPRQVYVHHEGEKYSNTCINSYTIPREEQEQVLFKSLKEICKHYGIITEPLEYEKVRQSLANINKATALFEGQMKAYGEALKLEYSSKLEEYGLLYSSVSHKNIFTSKF